jgi:hypothetical protein
LKLHLITFYSQSSIKEPFYGPRVNLMLSHQNTGCQGISIIALEHWNGRLANNRAFIYTLSNKMYGGAMLLNARL